MNKILTIAPSGSSRNMIWTRCRFPTLQSGLSLKSFAKAFLTLDPTFLYKQICNLVRMQKPKKVNQLQIGKNMRVELQIPPSPNVDLTTPRGGADNVHSNVGNLRTSHRNGSFVQEVGAFLSAISGGGDNAKTIEVFKAKMEAMGITFTYKEKDEEND